MRTAVLSLAALLGLGGVASAQIDDLGGTIEYVDTVANVVGFRDGRIVHYDPLWRVIVNGREVAVTDLAPGTVVAVAPTGTTAAKAVVPGSPQQAAAQVPPPPPAPPFAGAQRGVVASIDEANQTITLQDGRVVNLRETRVWRQENLGALRPGAEVYITAAAPAGTVVSTPSGTTTVTTTTTPAWTRRDVVHGRVTGVDHRTNQIVLSDGRTLYINPATPVWTIEPQTVAVNEIRPGEQVLVQVQQVVPVAGGEVGTYDPAGVLYPVVPSPSYEFPLSSKVAPDRVVIVRERQSP